MTKWDNTKKIKKILKRRESIDKLHKKLLKNIKAKLPELEKFLEKINGHWILEDLTYRYYHRSFKVYSLQTYTLKIVEVLKSLSPDKWDLNEDFMEIVKEGTGKEFKMEHNRNWSKHTRPILEAFQHARMFLIMAVKYGKELETAPQLLPSGWALLLYLYELR